MSFQGLTIATRKLFSRSLQMDRSFVPQGPNSVATAKVADTDMNEIGDVADLIGSQCGLLFDQYIREVFQETAAYSPTGPASKEYPQLWNGRRVRILFATDSPRWVEGKVVKFKQTCAGPYSRTTLWYMTVQFEKNETLQIGQPVQIHSLNMQKYNGIHGVILGPKTKDGRFPVKVADGDTTLGIKQQNLTGIWEIEREIGRTNINGGGTLVGDGTSDLESKRSFEWLDPADPCWEPKRYTLEEMERTVSLDMDELELTAERERLLSKFEQIAPTFFGLPDVDPSDGSLIYTPKRKAFDEYMKSNFLPKLVHLAKTDLKGLERLLMTEPLALWNSHHLNDVEDDVAANPEALKVIVSVLKRRCNDKDMVGMHYWICKHDGRWFPRRSSCFDEAFENNDDDFNYNRWVCGFARKIGDHYKKEEAYSKALP